MVVVGRPKSGGLADAIAEYQTRAARYWPMDVHEVREVSARSLPPDEVMAQEAERLLSRIPAGARVFVCDPAGDDLDSAQFASTLTRARDDATDVAFVIGGAHGLGASVKLRASKTLRLAPFTLPHELARLVLTEQLYRAGTIARGEPYHK